MPSDLKVTDATTTKAQVSTLVPFIFYLHFAIVYLLIVLFWCRLFFQEHFPSQEWQLGMVSDVQGFLFWGIPVAISFAGIVARVKFRTWAPYVIPGPDNQLACLHLDQCDPLHDFWPHR